MHAYLYRVISAEEKKIPKPPAYVRKERQELCQKLVEVVLAALGQVPNPGGDDGTVPMPTGFPGGLALRPPQEVSVQVEQPLPAGPVSADSDPLMNKAAVALPRSKSVPSLSTKPFVMEVLRLLSDLLLPIIDMVFDDKEKEKAGYVIYPLLHPVVSFVRNRTLLLCCCIFLKHQCGKS